MRGLGRLQICQLIPLMKNTIVLLIGDIKFVNW